MPGKLDKLQKMSGMVRIGGRGSVRRKRKVVHKTAAAEDQRMQGHLQQMGLNQITAIEEANLFHEDGTVIHFVNPRVMASPEAHTMAVSGKAETKQLQELFPGIINQLGIDNLSRVAQQIATSQKDEAAKEEDKKEEEEKKEEEPAAAAAAEAEKPKEEEKKEEEKKEESK